jgi:hypothetical protein
MEAIPPYTLEAKKIEAGIYEHYKGNRYKVLTIGRHSETLQEFVVYQGLYDKEDVWVRPIELFWETVSWNGEEVPRFRLVGNG